MVNKNLDQLFHDELKDMLSCENQILDSLPKLIKLASSADLKDALTKHLHETEAQVSRLDNIFSILGVPAKEKTCEAMAGILKEADELTKNGTKSPVLDAAIISAAQKVEHYEMASYGTLKSFAKQLDLDSEVIDLIEATLKEEANADKKLTKIAEGSIFSGGVNQEAAEQNYAGSKKGHK